jgi:ABC-2 type transport system ATP-binding protein
MPPSPAPTAAAEFPASAAPAVCVENLVHRYPPQRRSSRRSAAPTADVRGNATPALDGVSFAVQPGEIFAILGPNGGGKTTLFRILSTLLRPTSGKVAVFGHDPATQPHLVRGLLGVVFQSPSLDAQLTARENLMHQGHLYGLSGAGLDERINTLLNYFGLADRAGEYVARFSGGLRRRVEIAKALLHRPRLLLLDEPSTGLDPGARADLWKQLETLRHEQGMAIALTTHYMDEADRCDRLALLGGGKLLALDTPQRLKAGIGGDVITVEPEAGGTPAPPNNAGGDAAKQLCEDIVQRFGPWPEGKRPTVIDGRVHIEKPDGPAFVAQIAGALAGRIRSITVGRPTLDDVFMSLTGRRLGEDAADKDR